jgi:branched-chain amino acid transport system permease protein
MGVDVNRTIAITFLIGGALAGAAGVVQILYNNTTVWNLGFRFGLNAFTSAVLGGIGNLQGAVLGGIVLGLINAFSDRYLAANWTNAIVFGVLIAILVFKPTGLLGQQLADRA